MNKFLWTLVNKARCADGLSYLRPLLVTPWGLVPHLAKCDVEFPIFMKHPKPYVHLLPILKFSSTANSLFP